MSNVKPSTFTIHDHVHVICIITCTHWTVAIPYVYIYKNCIINDTLFRWKYQWIVYYIFTSTLHLKGREVVCVLMWADSLAWEEKLRLQSLHVNDACEVPSDDCAWLVVAEDELDRPASSFCSDWLHKYKSQSYYNINWLLPYIPYLSA